MTPLDDILMAVYRQDMPALGALDASDLRATDSDGRTALMHAVLASDASPAVVRLLIQRGVDVNARDARLGWTGLHFAASTGKVGIARALVDGGADPKLTNDEGRRPQDLAPDAGSFLRAIESPSKR